MTQISLGDRGSAASLLLTPSGALALGILPCPTMQAAEGGHAVLLPSCSLLVGTLPSNPKERTLPPRGGMGILNKRLQLKENTEFNCLDGQLRITQIKKSPSRLGSMNLQCLTFPES